MAGSKGIPVPIGLHMPELKQASTVDVIADDRSKPVTGKMTKIELRLDTEINN